jgi:PhzF family phenazine biosynthesis protein
MQAIALENHLAETAFVLKNGEDYELRWFTPEVEIDLCGHATLATAFILSHFVDPQAAEMRFHTKSGLLTVQKTEHGFVMDFPARMPVSCAIKEEYEQALGEKVLEAHMARDLVLVLETQEQVQNLKPDFSLLAK